MLLSQKKQMLKAKALKLNPTVIVSHKGLTKNVLNEIDIALEFHELIKVSITKKIQDSKKLVIQEICTQVPCELVQIIGNVAVIYRQKVKTK
jgi:RNA-binding protein